MTNRELLQQFVDHADDQAFQVLVERHIDAIFSAATRRLGGDRRLAEDAAQEVFVALARQAREIQNPDALPAWLHRHTCFVTANIVRSETRRKSRESIAAHNMRDKHNDEESAAFAHLDDLINNLPAPDREAILLKYFGRHDLQTVGRILGVSEDAAQKRVSRAVDKLTAMFRNRGLTVSATMLGAILSSQFVTAAPMALATTICAAALTGGSITVAATSATTIAITKAKLAVTATIIATMMTIPIAQHRANTRLRAENARLRTQLASVENNAVIPADAQMDARANTNSVVSASAKPSFDPEVLKLRAQVTALRAEVARTITPRGIRILAEPEFDSFEHTMEAEDVRQLLTYDSLHDAGAKTPEAAVQTYLWAKRLSNDPATIDQANVRAKQIVYQPGGSSFAGFAHGLRDDPLLDSKILKIEAVTFPTPDSAKVIVNFYNDTQGYQRGTISNLVRVGEEWKIDLGIGRH